MDNAPIKLTAALKDNIWGGTRLITDFGKVTSSDIIAESWELSTHPDGESTVSGGKFNGLKLSEYIKANGGDECLGVNAAKFDFFPLLIKFIDARDNLSIQVHPNDEYAMRVEGEYGKTEVWYVMDCTENSYLYYGLNRKISKEEFAERIKNNTLLEVLNKVPVHKGDVFFIPSGTVHAICGGILICEVQQNSNTTYRVYDYDRRGADGKPRELHIDKAIEISDLFPPAAVEELPENTIACCKYFTAKKIDCSSECEIDTDISCFRSLVILNGNGSLSLNGNKLDFKKGESIFIPAQNGKIEFRGKFEAILSYV